MSAFKNKAPLLTSTRFGVLLLWFLGSVGINLIRVNFGVSIVCMTYDAHDNVTSANNSLSTSNNSDVSFNVGQCETSQRPESKTGDYMWDRAARGLLGSALFFGYLTSTVAGGVLSQRCQPKWVHFGGVCAAVAASLLSPLASTWSRWGLFLTRFFLGIGSGVFVPTMSHMISSWSPIYEKSVMSSIQSSGYSVGSMVAFYMSGALCSRWGWQSTFYIPSAVAMLYLVLFAIFSSNDPDGHPCISDKEKSYINRERTQQQLNKRAIPWCSIFSSMPCVTLFICDFCMAWGGYTIGTSGPQYMRDVLKLDIKSNGLYNALPPLCKCVIAILAAVIIDIIRSKKKLSTTNARKVAQSIGFLAPAISMLAMGFISCERRGLAIFLLCVGEGLSGFTRSGLYTINIEVAPRYSSVISGIQGTFGTTAGIISPIVAGLLTPNGAESEWRMVFCIGGAVYIVGWIFFIVFADAEVQPWAIVDSDKLDSNPVTTDSATLHQLTKNLPTLDLTALDPAKLDLDSLDLASLESSTRDSGIFFNPGVWTTPIIDGYQKYTDLGVWRVNQSI